MTGTKFKYNQRTLRYERTGVSIVGLAFRGFCYLIFATLFFVGLVTLQNYVIDTPLEKSLRAENEALESHKVILTASLFESNERISQLNSEDQKLYERLFETKVIEKEVGNVEKKEEILTAEPEIFGQWEASTRSASSEIIKKAIARDAAWGKNIHIEKRDLNRLRSLPTLSPVEKMEVDKLVSGFGKRINPFHKGIYQHDGVDISLPSGTAVVATAPGIVLLANTSNQIAGFGNYIEIDHGNGIITRYAHLAELKVRWGQKVNKGQVIGSIGSSGGSIAPHLHYEVIRNGVNVNPVHYMVAGLTSTQYNALVEASTKQNQSLD